jgi:hypothetical protein
MNTRVEKLGPGSSAVFVNGQRHHETFVTREAARREAKRIRILTCVGDSRSFPLATCSAASGIGIPSGITCS